MTIALSTQLALRTELKERGFDYLSAARADRYVDLAYQELCEEFEWPFLETTNSATAPQTISGLLTVISVTNSTNETKLLPLDRRTVIDFDPSLNDTGTAAYYYITAGNIVNVHPANTSDTFLTRYYQIPDELDGTDTILVPSRYRYLIIEAAARHAYQDSDNPELAGMCRNEYNTGLLKMQQTLHVQQVDRPDEVQLIETNFDEWGWIV